MDLQALLLVGLAGVALLGFLYYFFGCKRNNG